MTSLKTAAKETINLSDTLLLFIYLFMLFYFILFYSFYLFIYLFIYSLRLLAGRIMHERRSSACYRPYF